MIILGCDGSLKTAKSAGNLFTLSNMWYSKDHILLATGPPRYIWILDPAYEKDRALLSSAINSNGVYYIRPDYPGHFLEICSIENPEVPLIRIDAGNSGIQKIFAIKDKVYLFEYDKEEPEALACWILGRKDDKLEVEKKIRIPWFKTIYGSGPHLYNIVDVAPWGDEVLIKLVWDFPSRSRWYTFNLATGEVKKIGMVNGYSLFLKCDTLKEVQKNLKHKK